MIIFSFWLFLLLFCVFIDFIDIILFYMIVVFIFNFIIDPLFSLILFLSDTIRYLWIYIFIYILLKLFILFYIYNSKTVNDIKIFNYNVNYIKLTLNNLFIYLNEYKYILIFFINCLFLFLISYFYIFNKIFLFLFFGLFYFLILLFIKFKKSNIKIYNYKKIQMCLNLILILLVGFYINIIIEVIKLLLVYPFKEFVFLLKLNTQRVLTSMLRKENPSWLKIYLLNKYYLFNYYNYLFNNYFLNSNILLKDQIFTNKKVYINNYLKLSFVKDLYNLNFDNNRLFSSMNKNVTLLDMTNYNNLYNLYNYYDINKLLINNIYKNKQNIWFFINKKNVNVKIFNILKNNMLRLTGLNHESFMSVEAVAITADQVGKDKKALANLIKVESLDYLQYLKNMNISINLDIIDEIDLDEYNDYVSFFENNIYQWLFSQAFIYDMTKYKSLNYIQFNFIKDFIILYKRYVFINKEHLNNIYHYNNTYYYYNNTYMSVIYNIYFYFYELKTSIFNINLIPNVKKTKFNFIKAFEDFADFKNFYFERKILDINFFILNFYDNTNIRGLKKLDFMLNEEIDYIDEDYIDDEKEDIIIENNLVPSFIIKLINYLIYWWNDRTTYSNWNNTYNDFNACYNIYLYHIKHKKNIKPLMFFNYVLFNTKYINYNLYNLTTLPTNKKLNIINFIEAQDYNNKKMYNDEVLDYLAKKKHDKILDSWNNFVREIKMISKKAFIADVNLPHFKTYKKLLYFINLEHYKFKWTMLYLSAGKAKMLKEHADELSYLHKNKSFGESEYIKKIFKECNSILLFCDKSQAYYRPRLAWYHYIRRLPNIELKKFFLNLYEFRCPTEYFDLSDYERFKINYLSVDYYNHIGFLRHYFYITMIKDGLFHYYRLNTAEIQELKATQTTDFSEFFFYMKYRHNVFLKTAIESIVAYEVQAIILNNWKIVSANMVFDKPEKIVQIDVFKKKYLMQNWQTYNYMKYNQDKFVYNWYKKNN